MSGSERLAKKNKRRNVFKLSLITVKIKYLLITLWQLLITLLKLLNQNTPKSLSASRNSIIKINIKAMLLNNLLLLEKIQRKMTSRITFLSLLLTFSCRRSTQKRKTKISSAKSDNSKR